MRRLSKPQENIYYTSMFYENSSVTNISGDVFWDFSVSLENLFEAVHFFLDNCKEMHTRIVLVNNIPMQIIQKDKDYLQIPVLKFESQKMYRDWVEEEYKKPISINDKLYRLYIVDVSGNLGIFCTIHHIISDATSFVSIGKNIGKYLRGERDIPMYSYDEYIETEELYEASKRHDRDKKYWLSEYKKYEINLYSEKEISDITVARKKFVLDKKTSLKIRDFCEKYGISEYAFLFSMLALHYARMTGKDSFFIGTPVLNRFNVREENMLGTFVNVVPIGFQFDDASTYLSVCSDTVEKIFSAFRHQRYSYMQLLKDLSDNQTPSEKLYDFSYSFLNVRTLESTIPNWFYSDKQSNSIEVQIDDHEQNGCYNICYSYQIKKFDEQHINEMHHSVCSLINAALENPNEKISETRIFPLETKILNDFNDTAVEYSKDKGVYELFESHVTKTPDKLAVIFKDVELTYSQLNDRITECADRLNSLGVKANDVVAVHLERSHELIVFQLAVLKIGAVFLPVDKRYPIDRIQQMCINCDVKLLISDEIDKSAVDANIMSLSEFELISPTKSAETVKNLNDCYIIYTSGSTGTPKGCLLTGKGLLNFCLNNNTLETLREMEKPIFACVNSASFDYFIAETLLPLTNGFTTVVLDDVESTMQEQFLSVVDKTNINVIMTTPTRLNIYYNDRHDCSPLKNIACICTSGEPLTPELLEQMYKKSPDAQVYNPIGPSECSVWDMGGRLEKVDGLDIHIGKPIANAQIYIVDKYVRPVPIGVTGEICIAGDGVGSGYINNPELTAERFVDNPFGEGKLYKTGDLAYWREDGNIVYVGRNDFQVKIRGLRIELGEIESVLQAVEGIERAVVVVRKDENDGQFICAFYTGKEIEAKELREVLSAKLPKYMVPHIFTHLSDMPMTVSGKINRIALPQVDFNDISTEIEYVAPETEEEKAFAEAVCSVLRVSSVNMLDNFFNIGGDSIRAIYVVSELEEKGYELHVADIMQSDTLSDVAKAMKSTSNKAIYDQDEVNGFIPFSPIMRAFLNENNNTIPRDFVHTSIISADCDEDTAKKALDTVISHHDMLRGAFTEDGIQIHPSSEREAYSFKSISIEKTEEAKEYLNNNICIDDDNLVNVVFCNTEKENLLSITVHHFLIDLISWEVLIKDFQTAVKQIKNREEISLPAKTASFKMWSDKLQEYSETISEDNKEYWKEIETQLDNAKSLCSQEENEAESYSFTFSKDISSKLINEVNNTYGTRINEVLLTALGLAVSEITDTDVGIIVESHGRAELHEPIATERTVGWFTSCYPVVVKKNDNVTEELINIKETMRRIPKNGIDYLLLSEGFHKNTDIIFNFYQNSVVEENRRNELIAFNAETSVFPNKINVNCFITDNVLTVNISVPKCKHKLQISEELGMEFMKQIEKLVDICTATDTVVKTRSDFSDDELTENELDELKDLFDWTDDDEKQY